MPDLRQSLRDFVATSNSGKYATEQELLSKFPELKGYNTQTLKDFVATSNSGKYTNEDEVFSKFPEFKVSSSIPVKKKDTGESNITTPQRNTTVSPSAAGSSATRSQKPNVSVPVGGGYSPLAIPALFSEATKTLFQTADDIMVTARKSLQEQGFFDDDIPDTDTPITDAIKKKGVQKKGELKNLPNGIEQVKNKEDGVMNGMSYIKGAANIGLKIINSTLPQDKKNVIISALNLGDSYLKRNIRDIEKVQDYALPKDNIAVNVSKGIVGMVPDLLLAEAMGSPVAAEGRLSKYASEVTKDAKPLIQKYIPKAAKFIEEAVKAPFTKIMAGKGAFSEMANTKEGESIVESGAEGAVEGALEGVYMHTLGTLAGKAMPLIAKGISKTGVNSAISTGLANPLANAGVFTTAKALRTAVEEGRLITADEAAMEAGTGIGFSLLHAGSLAKNHNELNHYADNTLKTNEVESFKRVVNETKDNLDLVYNRDIAPEEISKLQEARDEMRAAIVKEPDLNNKKLLINEAIKIQNQLDANSAINNILNNKETIIEEINSNPDTSENLKEFYTKKIAAIADHFDRSEFGLKKKELNSKINKSQKKLDDASMAFTNLDKPSDRIEAEIELKKRRQEVEDLKNELTELITNKVNENAVQKQTTDESVLRTEQPGLELQGVGEGNTQPEGVTQESVITEKPEEVTPVIEQTFKNKTDSDLEKRMSEIEDKYNGIPSFSINQVANREYNQLEKEMEKRERDSVFNVPLEEVNNAVDNLIKKEKEMPNGYGSFIEKRDASDTKEVANKYLEPKKITDSELSKDFVDGLMGNPTTWYADGLKVRESLKEGINRGKNINEFIDKAIEVYTKDGYSEKEAREVVSEMVQKILKGAEEISEANPVVKEATPVLEAKPTQTIDEAIKTLQESKEYAEVDDIQKEKLVRQVRKEFGLKEKAAPSVNKLFGKIKDIAKVTITEKAGLVKQIKDLARGARIAKVAIKNATEGLASQVSELQKGGKINATQAKAVVNKFSKVNVLSETSVRRFTDYMTKVFDNALYAKELEAAKDTKSTISKLSKNKTKNANLRELGKKFTQIDPSMVDNISAYNENAIAIEDAIRGSSLRGLKETVDISKLSEYIDKIIEEQNNKIEQDRIAESEDLLGLTEKEVNDILEGKEAIKKEKADELREKVQTQFDIYSDQIKKAIETGENPITGEEVSYSKADKEIIEKFMAMDLASLNIKEALAASDSLNNFIVNESTANMENVLSKYTGEYEAKNFKGRAKDLKKLWSKPFARALTEGGTPMGEIFTKMFKGATEGAKFAKASGMNKIVNGKAIALAKIDSMTKDYIDRFYKKKANGEDFNTAYNDAERGIVSDLRRHLVGTEEQIQKEFDRRVGILDQSIKTLEEGTEKEQQKAKIYKKVYDKIVDGSKSVEDIENKADKVNLEAVKKWQENHEESWDDITKYMLNVHNTILEKGVNYSSPDKYSKLSSEEASKPLQDNEAMYGRNGDYLYKREANGFMKAEFPEKLPEGRYRDYSFDQNNVNSMHDALVDLNTGAAVRQLEAFRKSDGFKEIIPSVEDRNLLNRRFKLYVENLRNKGNSYGAEDLKPIIKTLDKIGTLGVGLALGSPTQMGKQTIPVLFNTLANAGRANLGAPFNPKYIEWLSKSGYAIGNRGVESQAQIESLNKKIETASKKGPAQLAKAVAAAQKFWLREFLVRGDVYIAKASWQTYYEKALKKQGENSKNIDYSDHKINEEAADYAEMMTQRQQNINDPDLGGSWFTSNRTERKMLGKIFLNFANFRMNQSSRLAADLTTLGNWSVATPEDRAIAARSLGGYALESTMYRLMSVGIGLGIGSIAQSIRGNNESQEEKDKRVEKAYKSARSGAALDFFSPAPFLDFAVKPLLSYTTEAIEEQTGLPLSTYGTSKQTFVESLGGYGIAVERAAEVWDVLNLAATGTYEDEYGKEKEISDQDQETIKALAPAAVLSAIGVLPTDIGSGVRNVVKYSKTPKKEIDKKQLKERNPDMYERMYGEDSQDYRMKQYKKEMKERSERD